MKERIFIYQVLPRLFGNSNATNKQNGTIEENGSGKFSDFSTVALNKIKEMGFTHIWYTGVIEHATKTDYSAYGIARDHRDVVKGEAGSPYAIKDYYDVCPDLADNVEDRVKEFEDLIKRTHECGMKVIIDFVPNHVARQYKSDKKPRGIKDLGEGDEVDISFSPQNNFYYLPHQNLDISFVDSQEESKYEEYPAKVTGNDRFSNQPSVNDWYETIKLNYGVDYLNNRASHFNPIPDTWTKMEHILLYWLQKGVDAFRCDMMEMVPVEFWAWVIPRVKTKKKSILFIGEAYDNNQYENYTVNGGFDYLYDKVDLYDTIRDVICGYKPTSEITFAWQRVERVKEKMLNFLENHDEQRIASGYFAGDARKALPGLHTITLMSSNPVMIYFGQELGEKGMDQEGFSGLDGRTTIFDYWSVDSLTKWINKGKFDGKKLSEDQKKLREQYIQTIKLASSETCFIDGEFYDLMYANYENYSFNSTKQYAFLRFTVDEFILVISNFSSQKEFVTVDIPTEVFEFMGILPNTIKTAKELFSGKMLEQNNYRLSSISYAVNAYDSVAIKFSKK